MLPWLLAALTLAAVVWTAPLLGEHLHGVIAEVPQPAFARRPNPVAGPPRRWIGDAPKPARKGRGSGRMTARQRGLSLAQRETSLRQHQAGPFSPRAIEPVVNLLAFNQALAALSPLPTATSAASPPSAPSPTPASQRPSFPSALRPPLPGSAGQPAPSVAPASASHLPTTPSPSPSPPAQPAAPPAPAPLALTRR